MITEKTEYQCTVAVTLEVIGGKWKAVILWHLSHKTLRFSQLQRRLPGVTQKMLTQQLRELERDGMIHREVYPGGAAAGRIFSYRRGTHLLPLLTLMCTWGRQRLQKISGENRRIGPWGTLCRFRLTAGEKTGFIFLAFYVLQVTGIRGRYRLPPLPSS